MHEPIISRKNNNLTYKNKAIRPHSLNRGVNRHVSLIYLTMENVRPGRVPLWPAKLAMTRLLEGISWMMEGLRWAHQFHNHLPLHTWNTIRPLVQIGAESQSNRQPAGKGSRKPLSTNHICCISLLPQTSQWGDFSNPFHISWCGFYKGVNEIWKYRHF